jgi:hypothetical protein
MTRKFRDQPPEAGRLGEAWQDLEYHGEAPALTGRMAQEAARDKIRKRPMSPSERRRRGRKISPTLPEDLTQELRDICKELGHVDEAGNGVIDSGVVTWFLRLAVEAYRAGLLEQVETDVVTKTHEMRWKARRNGDK